MADTAHSRTIGERTPKRSISKMIPLSHGRRGYPDKVKMHRDNLTMSYSYQEEEKWFINVALRAISEEINKILKAHYTPLATQLIVWK